MRGCWSDCRIPPAPPDHYETEMNLAALDWVEALAGKLHRGVVLLADYGLPRTNFMHRIAARGPCNVMPTSGAAFFDLERVGTSDLTTHVEWTSLAEQAELCGLRVAGFADQIISTGLLSTQPELASAGAEKSRALQTLIHPEFLGEI